jgi:hypothetical protein
MAFLHEREREEEGEGERCTSLAELSSPGSGQGQEAEVPFPCQLVYTISTSKRRCKIIRYMLSLYNMNEYRVLSNLQSLNESGE